MKLVFQKIYCLYSPQFPARGKVGVSTNVEARRRQIEADLQMKFGGHVRVKRLLALPIITNAYNFEAAIHTAMRRMFYPECNTMRGTSGWTEWFWYANVFTAVFVFLLAKIAGLECAGAVGFCTFVFIILPLDFALFVAILALAEYAIIAGLIWGACSLLTQ